MLTIALVAILILFITPDIFLTYYALNQANKTIADVMLVS